MSGFQTKWQTAENIVYKSDRPGVSAAGIEKQMCGTNNGPGRSHINKYLKWASEIM